MQVDARVNLVSLVLCCCHGPLDIFSTPCFDAEITLHSCLLWIFRPNNLLFHRGKSNNCFLVQLPLLSPVQLQSTVLALFSAIIQLACLIWYLVSYFPMGSSGLRLATTFGARRAAAWMSG